MVYRNGRKLRVAVIMDEFTYGCYSPECEMLQITPQGFKEEIDGFQPDFLFIESVWRGKDNLWRYKLNDDTRDLTKLVEYCRECGLPVVFWSKEDPVHFGVFLKVASMADYVFTTDADCISLYKTCLGHEKVYYLPFAAQPAIHNPIEEYERQDKFCFAGSFYVNYKERSNVFMNLIPFLKQVGIDIYDRNFKKATDDGISVASPMAENYQFPAELQENILGSLPYSEISKAYKGYKYGVNMTSMVYSSFMFARRAFELLACNTPTISNYSRGIKLLLGDLLMCTDDAERMKLLFEEYCSEQNYRKFRLAGLRWVLSQHLYEDRLNRIVAKVFGYETEVKLPRILVVCTKQSDKVQRMFDNQSYADKQLLIADGSEVDLSNFDYVTIFAENNYYGKNYLMDLALATRFAPNETVIGKVADSTYVRVNEAVSLDRQMLCTKVLGDKVAVEYLAEYNREHTILALDEFNFCGDCVCDMENVTVDDMDIFCGKPIEEIYAFTDAIRPIEFSEECDISVQELFEEAVISENDKTDKMFENGNFILSRDVDDDEIIWIRTEKNYLISDYAKGSRIGFKTLISDKIGNVRCQIEYYDASGKKLSYLNFAIGGFSLLRISDNATSFKLIFRLRGKAAVTFEQFKVVSPDSYFSAPLLLGDKVCVTGREISSLSLAEREHIKQNNMDVLKINENELYLPYSEQQGINVISCVEKDIQEFVESNKVEVEER